MKAILVSNSMKESNSDRTIFTVNNSLEENTANDLKKLVKTFLGLYKGKLSFNYP
jgi:hypothetical protein